MGSNPISPTIQQVSLTERQTQALLIVLQPELYKICEGCDSIVTAKTCICPNCKAYRFDSDEQRVVDHAQHLANTEQSSVTHDDLF